jgi:hypothetical protein
MNRHVCGRLTAGFFFIMIDLHWSTLRISARMPNLTHASRAKELTVAVLNFDLVGPLRSSTERHG